jgi:hypothetical protein
MSLETQVLVKNLSKGIVYKVRYRAINSIGTGAWSELAFMRAAQVPIPPPSPIIAFVDNTKINLQLKISSDDGGSGILSYHLYVDEGLIGSDF